MATLPLRRQRTWTIGAMAALMLAATIGASAQAASPASNATGINIRVPRSTIAIAGTLSRAAGGAPLANASVIVLDSDNHQAGFAVSSSTGKYRIGDLDHGDYRIMAGPGEGGDPTLQWGFYRAAAPGGFTVSMINASVLHYAGAKLTGKDVALPLGFTISGRVTRVATGEGVPNISVSARTIVPGAHFFADANVSTDSTGHYQIRGLSTRPYRVHINALFATANVQSGCYRSSAAHHFTPNCSNATNVTISGSSVTGINTALPTGLVVTGRVVDRTGAENPLCAYVTVADPITLNTVWYANACGPFSVDHLSPGDYLVAISPQVGVSFVPGFYSRVNPTLWANNAAQAETVHLTANQNLGIIRPSAGHSIRGFVRDHAGHPLDGVTVYALRSDGWCCVYANTASDGSYELAGLAAMRHVVGVSPSFLNLQTGWYAASAPGHFTAHRADASSLAMSVDRTGINVRTPAGFTISGRILDENGNGLQASVTAVGSGAPNGSYGTATDGRYSIDGFAPGGYLLRVYPVTAGTPRPSGWYSATAPGHFVRNRSDATRVHVGP